MEPFSYKSSSSRPLGRHIVDNIKMNFTVVFRVKMPYQKPKKLIEILDVRCLFKRNLNKCSKNVEVRLVRDVVRNQYTLRHAA